MSALDLQSASIEQLGKENRPKARTSKADLTLAGKTEKDRTGELLEACQIESEQLRSLYTRENDRLRQRLASVTHAFSSALDLIALLCSSATETSQNCNLRSQSVESKTFFSAFGKEAIQQEGTDDSPQHGSSWLRLASLLLPSVPR